MIGGKRWNRMSWVVAAAAFLGAMAFGVAPASAILIHLHNGKWLSYQPRFGSSPSAASPSSAASGSSLRAPFATPRGASNFDKVFSNLDYSGGPVMPSNANYTILWDPSGYTGTGFQPDFAGGVNTFFQDLAHDSGGSNNSDSVSTQYNDVSGDTAAYSSTYGGTVTDKDALPSSGCVAPSGDPCLTDAQLQTELAKVITANGWTTDLHHEYFLLLPPGIASCFDSNPADGCTDNFGGTNPQGYCAYHSYSSTTSPFVYAVIPDTAGTTDPSDGDPNCDPFTIAGEKSYLNTTADGVLSAVSHEHNESITDPQPNNAWTDWQSGCSPFDQTCGGEIGDKCAYDQVSDGTTPPNETINGVGYWIQGEWSNQGKGCAYKWTSNTNTATASFTSSYSGGPTVNFDASSSKSSGSPIQEYVWQFNDMPGPNGPQNFTVETSSPTISHSFAPGKYQVALTVMDADGTSNGTANSVTVLPSPPSATFSPPSGFQGTPLTFDGSGSRDPNTGGTITSYRWNFGDGATGSAPTMSHAFAPGSYTVTLTVTDNYGQSNSVSHSVVVLASCVVPNVKGKTRSKATNLLHAAGCNVGKVNKPKHKPKKPAAKHKKWALVVASESPGSGTTLLKGSAVNLRLVWKQIHK